MTWLVKIGGGCTALIAIGGVLAYLSSFLAWSGDIKRLDLQQADVAIETYGNKVRSLILLAPKVDDGTPSSRAWNEELGRARDQLRRSEDRKIELSK